MEVDDFNFEEEFAASARRPSTIAKSFLNNTKGTEDFKNQLMGQ